MWTADDWGYLRLDGGDMLESDRPFVDELGFIRIDARAGMTLCTPGKTVPCGKVCRTPKNCAKGKGAAERKTRIGDENLKEFAEARRSQLDEKRNQRSVKPASQEVALPSPSSKVAKQKPKAKVSAPANDNGERVKKVLDVSNQEADAIADAIVDFTVEGYKPIRAAQAGGKYTPPPPKEQALKQAEMVEKYITAAPKHDGEIYRGLNFTSPDQVKQFIDANQNGMEMNAMSSFTSDFKVASRFAQGVELDDGGKFAVLLIVRGNKSGASVAEFSEFPEEGEVLVPSKTKYKIKEHRNKGKATVLILEEA